jgi:MerR family transcriptional regulator, light-induced transcriptional regulator
VDSFDQQTIHLFSTRQAELSDRIVMSFFRTRHGSKRPYNFGGFSGCMRDVNTHVSAVANAVAVNEPALFMDYALAAGGALASRGIPANHLADIFEVTAKCLIEVIPEDTAARAVEFIGVAAAELHKEVEPPSYIADGNRLSGSAECYLDALLAGDCEAAEACVLRALSDGVSVEDLYLDLLQPCQRELGRLWQMKRISVAKEHYCTACTRSIMAQLISTFPKPVANGRNAVATCVIGELHDLGLAMVCDFIRMRGWQTQYVGANLPPEEIIGAIVDCKAALLAVSATMVWHLRWVHDVIELVRASEPGREARILVGGRPFLLAPDLWRKVDADGSAPDARAAAELAEELTAAATTG